MYKLTCQLAETTPTRRTSVRFHSFIKTWAQEKYKVIFFTTDLGACYEPQHRSLWAVGSQVQPHPDHACLQSIPVEVSRIVRYRSSQPQRSHKFSTSACCPASLILPIITWIEVGGDLGVSDLQLESPVQKLYLSLVLQ